MKQDKWNVLDRYVREVLNALTVAGFVRLEEGTGGKDGREARYWVPQACRATLQKVGASCVLISAYARRYSAVRECFEQDGPNCKSFSLFHNFCFVLVCLRASLCISVCLCFCASVF